MNYLRYLNLIISLNKIVIKILTIFKVMELNFYIIFSFIVRLKKLINDIFYLYR